MVRRVRHVLAGEIGELFNVENESDTPIAENGGARNARNRTITLLDTLDHDLLVAAQLIDHDAEAGSIAGVADNHHPLVRSRIRPHDIEQLAEVHERDEVAAQLQSAPAVSTARTCSPKRAKSAERTEDAMMIDGVRPR